jgi:hypothetical protein
VVKIYYLHLGDNIPIYVGKTKNNLKKRLREHKIKIKNSNLIIEMLEEVDERGWKFWECYWIEQFTSWGFDLKNQNMGGGGPNQHSHKVKKQIGAIHKGNSHASKSVLQFSLEGKLVNEYSSATFAQELFNQPQSISKACNGYNISAHNHLWCYKSDYTKELIENKINIYNKFRTKIQQYNLDGEFIREFTSQTDAAKSLNKPTSAINECCKGKRKQAYGYKWKYKQ